MSTKFWYWKIKLSNLNWKFELKIYKNLKKKWRIRIKKSNFKLKIRNSWIRFIIIK